MTLESMIRTTGEHTRDFVRNETQRWTRFVRARAVRTAAQTRELLTRPALERRLLAEASDALRALEHKVGARLLELEAPTTVAAPAKRGKSKRRRTVPSAPASGPSLISGGRKAS